MVSLKKLFLGEAGMQQRPVGKGKLKGPKWPSPKKGASDHNDDGAEETDPESAPDEEWDEDSEIEKAWADAHPGLAAAEAEAQSSFASKSQPPSKALQGGKPGLQISGDKATLEALQTALESVRSRDEDLADWIDDCVRAISKAVRRGADSFDLPKFEATPGLDSFNDDTGEDED